MKKKTLKFNKQEIFDLTGAEQKRIIGGIAPTVGDYCTVTCENKDTCGDEYGMTGPCDSNYRGHVCSPESDIAGQATCAMSAIEMCHSDRNCTYADCTQTCPPTYGDQTCKCQ